jgi:hypothetical protein
MRQRAGVAGRMHGIGGGFPRESRFPLLQCLVQPRGQHRLGFVAELLTMDLHEQRLADVGPA